MGLFSSGSLFALLLGLCGATSTTIHWHAPIFSGGGYCSEALDFAHVARNKEIKIQVHQHGDSFNSEYMNRLLTPVNFQFLTDLSRPSFDSNNHEFAEDSEISIMVCHSEPGAWHAPQPHYQTATSCPPTAHTAEGSMYVHSLNEHKSIIPYKVGRTMFETNRIPSGWVDRCNYMDEVWVPTDFAREVFVREGVHPEKVRVVPEPVDTSLYRPVDIGALVKGESGSSSDGNSIDSDNSAAPSSTDGTLSATDGDVATVRYDDLSPALKSLIEVKFPAKIANVDKKRGSSFVRTLKTVSSTTSIFLFVGKWEQRKGIRQLLQAYLSEFSNQDDDVLLVILSSGYHSTESTIVKLHKMLLDEVKYQRAMLGRMPEHRAADTVDFSTMDSLPTTISAFDLERDVFPRVRIVESIPQAAMAVLYSLVDAVVIPSVGEGWGRPHVEALACGTPVIATNWSGVTAYLTEENGYPIDIGKELVRAQGWKGHSWAAPSISSLKKHMQSVHNDKDGAKRRGARGRADMVQKFSFAVMGDVLQREVDRIEDKLLPHRSEQREKRRKKEVVGISSRAKPKPEKRQKSAKRKVISEDDLEL